LAAFTVGSFSYLLFEVWSGDDLLDEIVQLSSQEVSIPFEKFLPHRLEFLFDGNLIPCGDLSPSISGSSVKD
jgi:hypothetical protein